ncbi:MAG: hypothetical protein AAGC58_13000 [Asticcacaulis sp.]
MILRSIFSGGVCAVAGLWALSAAAEGARPYLSWPGKSAGVQATAPRLEKALPNPATGTPGFDIPPSPYGQVGSPYVQPVPQSAPKPVVVPVAPVRAEVPRPAEVMPPPPVHMLEPVAPKTIAQPVTPPVEAPVKTPPVAVAPVVAPVVAEVPAPAVAVRTEEGAFVLPATSKYAGRQAAPKAETQTQTQAQTQNQTQAVTATAPALSEPLIVPENESVFVPGMRVTDPATQSPRFYSLHRAYGYQPDPVDSQGGDLKIDPSRVETKD